MDNVFEVNDLSHSFVATLLTERAAAFQGSEPRLHVIFRITSVDRTCVLCGKTAPCLATGETGEGCVCQACIDGAFAAVMEG